MPGSNSSTRMVADPACAFETGCRASGADKLTRRSPAIRLPKSVVEALNLRAADEIEFSIAGARTLRSLVIAGAKLP